MALWLKKKKGKEGSISSFTANFMCNAVRMGLNPILIKFLKKKIHEENQNY